MGAIPRDNADCETNGIFYEQIRYMDPVASLYRYNLAEAAATERLFVFAHNSISVTRITKSTGAVVCREIVLGNNSSFIKSIKTLLF